MSLLLCKTEQDFLITLAFSRQVVQSHSSMIQGTNILHFTTVDKLGNVCGRPSILCIFPVSTSWSEVTACADVNTEIQNLKDAIAKVIIWHCSVVKTYHYLFPCRWSSRVNQWNQVPVPWFPSFGPQPPPLLCVCNACPLLKFMGSLPSMEVHLPIFESLTSSWTSHFSIVFH